MKDLYISTSSGSPASWPELELYQTKITSFTPPSARASDDSKKTNKDQKNKKWRIKKKQNRDKKKTKGSSIRIKKTQKLKDQKKKESTSVGIRFDTICSDCSEAPQFRQSCKPVRARGRWARALERRTMAMVED